MFPYKIVKRRDYGKGEALSHLSLQNITAFLRLELEIFGYGIRNSNYLIYMFGGTLIPFLSFSLNCSESIKYFTQFSLSYN